MQIESAVCLVEIAPKLWGLGQLENSKCQHWYHLISPHTRLDRLRVEVYFRIMCVHRATGKEKKPCDPNF